MRVSCLFAGDEAAEGSLLQQQRQQQSSEHVVQQQLVQVALRCERKQSRQLRAAYTAELGRRNELQTLLLDSIQQAKQQYKQAHAAHAAQAQAAADTAGVSWQQSGTAAGSSGSSRPGSRMQARQHRRPASAAPYCGGSPKQRQAWSAAADNTAFTAGIGAAADGACEQTGAAAAAGIEGFLDQQAWGKLLNDLLSRQQVLELLLQNACPDLVAAAQQLHQGQAAAATAAAGAPPAFLHQQQERPEQQQQGRAGHMLQPLAEQSREEHDLCDIIEMQPVDIQAAPADMFMIQEDDGDSQTTDSQASDAEGGMDQCDLAAGNVGSAEHLGEQFGVELGDSQSGEAQHEHDFEQQQHQHQQEEQEQEQLLPVQQQEQDLRQHLQQAQEPPQLQYRLLSHTRCSPTRQTAVSGSGGPPPHRCSTAGGASGGATGPPYDVHHPPAGVVTLASMSGPVLGCFPVRKLLHSASCGSNTHGSQHSHQRTAIRASDSSSCSSSLHKAQHGMLGQHRRPESAAATSGSRCSIGLGLGDGGLAVRPVSAAVTAGAISPSKHSRSRAAHGAWQHGAQQGPCDVTQQQRGGISRPQQQQQPSRKQLHTPSGVAAGGGASEGLSICSWGSPDGGKGAQLLLKTFLQGQ